jgi:hypothetical protein
MEQKGEISPLVCARPLHKDDFGARENGLRERRRIRRKGTSQIDKQLYSRRIQQSAHHT